MDSTLVSVSSLSQVVDSLHYSNIQQSLSAGDDAWADPAIQASLSTILSTFSSVKAQHVATQTKLLFLQRLLAGNIDATVNAIISIHALKKDSKIIPLAPVPLTTTASLGGKPCLDGLKASNEQLREDIVAASKQLQGAIQMFFNAKKEYITLTQAFTQSKHQSHEHRRQLRDATNTLHSYSHHKDRIRNEIDGLAAHVEGVREELEDLLYKIQISSKTPANRDSVAVTQTDMSEAREALEWYQQMTSLLSSLTGVTLSHVTPTAVVLSVSCEAGQLSNTQLYDLLDNVSGTDHLSDSIDQCSFDLTLSYDVTTRHIHHVTVSVTDIPIDDIVTHALSLRPVDATVADKGGGIDWTMNDSTTRHLMSFLIREIRHRMSASLQQRREIQAISRRCSVVIDEPAPSSSQDVITLFLQGTTIQVDLSGDGDCSLVIHIPIDYPALHAPIRVLFIGSLHTHAASSTVSVTSLQSSTIDLCSAGAIVRCVRYCAEQVAPWEGR